MRHGQPTGGGFCRPRMISLAAPRELKAVSTASSDTDQGQAGPKEEFPFPGRVHVQDVPEEKKGLLTTRTDPHAVTLGTKMDRLEAPDKGMIGPWTNGRRQGQGGDPPLPDRFSPSLSVDPNDGMETGFKGG